MVVGTAGWFATLPIAFAITGRWIGARALMSPATKQPLASDLSSNDPTTDDDAYDEPAPTR